MPYEDEGPDWFFKVCYTFFNYKIPFDYFETKKKSFQRWFYKYKYTNLPNLQ